MPHDIKLAQLLLKSCPFCGSAALQVKYALNEFGVICNQCECIGPPTRNATASMEWWNRRVELPIIEKFYKEVCDRAEKKMLTTGKLEGAHYAAMKQIIEELRNDPPIMFHDGST